MAIRVIEVRQVVTRDGLEIQGISHTPRGTKFILKATGINTEGKSREDILKEVEAALAEFYPTP